MHFTKFLPVISALAFASCSSKATKSSNVRSTFSTADSIDYIVSVGVHQPKQILACKELITKNSRNLKVIQDGFFYSVNADNSQVQILKSLSCVASVEIARTKYPTTNKPNAGRPVVTKGNEIKTADQVPHLVTTKSGLTPAQVAACEVQLKRETGQENLKKMSFGDEFFIYNIIVASSKAQDLTKIPCVAGVEVEGTMYPQPGIGVSNRRFSSF